jgi:DNA-binding response OmpR family regulator
MTVALTFPTELEPAPIPLQSPHPTSATRPTVPLLVVDRDRWQTRVAGVPIYLTRLEFMILAELYEAHGRVLTRSVLADRVGIYSGATRALDVHVCRLRRKLGPAAMVLVTVRGVGWQLR